MHVPHFDDLRCALTIPDATVMTGETTLVGTFAGTPLVQGTEYAAVVNRVGMTPKVRHRVGDACSGMLWGANGAGSFVALPPYDVLVSIVVS
jgi:hypothetical protein